MSELGYAFWGLASLGPIPLAGSGGEAGSLMIWVWLGLAAAAALVAGAWISRLAWQDERSRTPEYRAFRRLAWELRLGPLSRRTLDKLAAGARLPPVALLLSSSALDRAARLGGLSASEHERLAKRLFGNR